MEEMVKQVSNIALSKMYCPQCGRKLGLDSDARFCRYCGFLLNDTKDTLRGYTEIKREGFKYINLSYILLLVLFWVQYFDLIPWHFVWGGRFWLITIFGFVFGLWFMGNWVIDKPAKYVRGKDEKIEGEQRKALPPSQSIPVTNADKGIVNTKEMVAPPSVTDHTTRKLPDT